MFFPEEKRHYPLQACLHLPSQAKKQLNATVSSSSCINAIWVAKNPLINIWNLKYSKVTWYSDKRGLSLLKSCIWDIEQSMRIWINGGVIVILQWRSMLLLKYLSVLVVPEVCEGFGGGGGKGEKNPTFLLLSLNILISPPMGLSSWIESHCESEPLLLKEMTYLSRDLKKRIIIN